MSYGCGGLALRGVGGGRRKGAGGLPMALLLVKNKWELERKRESERRKSEEYG